MKFVHWSKLTYKLSRPLKSARILASFFLFRPKIFVELWRFFFGLHTWLGLVRLWKGKRNDVWNDCWKVGFFFFSFKKYIFLLTLSIPHCQQQICRNRSIRFLWNSQNFVCLHGGWQTATLRNNFDRSTLIDDLSVAFFQWTLRVVYSWSFIPYLLLSDSLRLTQELHRL